MTDALNQTNARKLSRQAALNPDRAGQLEKKFLREQVLRDNPYEAYAKALAARIGADYGLTELVLVDSVAKGSHADCDATRPGSIRVTLGGADLLKASVLFLEYEHLRPYFPEQRGLAGVHQLVLHEMSHALCAGDVRAGRLRRDFREVEGPHGQSFAERYAEIWNRYPWPAHDLDPRSLPPEVQRVRNQLAQTRSADVFRREHPEFSRIVRPAITPVQPHTAETLARRATRKI